MTYEEALEFFARYGNVCCDVDRLRGSIPTLSQLESAVNHAISSPHDQPHEVAVAAAAAIQKETRLFEEPKDPTVVRPETVQAMLDCWSRGGTYTYPYTPAETQAAAARWAAEGGK